MGKKPAVIYLIIPIVLLVVVGRSLASGAPAAPQAATSAWHTYANGDSIQALAVEGDYVWAGTSGGGVVRWDVRDGSYVQYLWPQDGLSGNDVYAVAVDAQGRKWFGTMDRGVSVLDGNTWEVYTPGNSGLPGYDVWAIAVDRQGRQWFGTDRGVGVHAGDRWTTYNTDNSGLAFDNVWALAVDDQHRAWFGFNYCCGVSMFDGTAWTTYTVQNTSHRGSQVTTVLTATAVGSYKVPVTITTEAEAYRVFASGFLMIGTDPTFYSYEYYDSAAQAIVFKPSLQQAVAAGTPVYPLVGGLAHNSVKSIAAAGQGKIWFGTEGGASLFDGTTWTTYTAYNSGLVSNYVYAIAVDPLGRTWFGTGMGLSLLDGGVWTTYYPWYSIAAIACDLQGRLFVALYSGYGGYGLTVYYGATWRTYSTRYSGLAANYVRAIVSDKQGRTWFGTGWGVSVFDGSGWRTLDTFNSGLGNNDVEAIAIDRAGRRWFGTWGGVSMFDGIWWSNFTSYNSGLANDHVQAIAVDAAGNKWFGTEGVTKPMLAVSKLAANDATWTTYPSIKEAIEDNYAVVLTTLNLNGLWTTQPPDRVWHRAESGVAVFDGTQWVTYTLESTSQRGPQVTTVRAPTPAGSTQVPVNFASEKEADQALASGYVMFGEDSTFYNYQGFSSYDRMLTVWPPLKQDLPAGAPVYAVARVGLGSNQVNAMAVGRHGEMWFATNGGGVSVFDGTAWTNYRWRNSGLPYDEVRAVAIDERGRAWFGTEIGVTVFDGRAWTTYTPANSGLAYHWAPFVRVITLAGQGRKWFATDGGLSPIRFS
jgi:ligand-binding sensor domain-containing protein